MGIELVVSSSGVELPATLSLPPGTVERVLIPLHPASDGGRVQPHFDHLASVLPVLGTAVLRYDRRGDPDGQGVPFELQLGDVTNAKAVARRECGDVPIGLWGFSQGAWIAVAAAAAMPVDFLVLVAFCAVTPAAQMRFGTAEHARRAGCDPTELAQLHAIRLVWERFQRGELTSAELQRHLDASATTRWFEFSWLPRDAPTEPSWTDMDFDPRVGMRQLDCPILAFYGERDEWVPVTECVEAWHAESRDEDHLELHVLAGLGHDVMTADAGRVRPSPEYESVLLRWVTAQRAE